MHDYLRNEDSSTADKPKFRDLYSLIKDLFPKISKFVLSQYKWNVPVRFYINQKQKHSRKTSKTKTNDPNLSERKTAKQLNVTLDAIIK